MKKITKIIITTFCYVVLLTILLAYSLNFNLSYIIDGGDTSAYLNPFIFLEKGKYVWEDSVFGRINILAIIQIIYSAPLALLYLVFPPNIAQFVYWVFLFSLLPISFFLLSHYLTKNNLISFYTGILYSLNLFTAIIHHTPVYHMLYLHGVTPLLVLILLKTYENNKLLDNYIILFAILYLPLLRMHNMYIIYFFILPLISIIILKFYKKQNLSFNKFFKKCFTIYLLIIVLSLPYFIVLAVSQSVQANPNVEFSEKSVEVSKIHANLLNIIRFISTYGWEKVWNEISGLQGFSAASIYHTNPLLILLTFYPILLALMLSLVIMSNSDRYKSMFVSSLLGLALIFLFLAKMINSPFGQINEFLYSNSTIFLILFRSAWKYMQIPYILTICLIISIGLKELHTKYIKENKKFILLIVVLFLIHIAYISPAIITHSKLINKAWVIKVPKEYYDVAEFFNNQQEEFRILPLPLSKHPTGYVPYTWGYAGPDILYTLLEKPMIEKYHNMVLPPHQLKLISKIEQIPPNEIYKINNYSKILNIKYILIRNDVDMHHKYIKLHYSPREYIKYLRKEVPIRKVYHFGNLTVFELKEYGERVYILSNHSQEKPAKIISYEKINPTLWKVKINAKKPFMLSFAEAYDPLWEARIYKDGKLVEKVRSIPLYSVINGFWINETGNITIVIRYVPQDWFELGLKISALTFIGCIGYLFYDWRKEKGDGWAREIERKVRRALKKIYKR